MILLIYSGSSFSNVPTRGFLLVLKARHIIIAEEDKILVEKFKNYFLQKGFICHHYDSIAEALVDLKKTLIPGGFEIALFLCEINKNDDSTLAQLIEAQALSENTSFIVLTNILFKQKALQAISQGALHYLVKPFDFSDVVHLFEHAINYQILNKENSLLRNEMIAKNSFQGIIGRSESMRKLFTLINQIANSTANILIQGATGTGKEVIAKAIHNLSSRKDKPFVAINCSAIPETLLESELFGHAKGSFTGAIQNKKGLFEEANGGTLFLDEIGDLPHSLQAKLLRVIQERTVRPVGENMARAIDIRIICATHKDLKDMMTKQSFREDLYYRLSVIPLTIPMLNQRREDIPLLANHFLNKFAVLNNKKFIGFSGQTLNFMMNYAWPGNVRELENAIERAVILCNGDKIELEDLSLDFSSENNLFISRVESELPTLADLEKKYIEFVLTKTDNQKERAAEILGLNRKTLYRKEKEFGWDKTPHAAHDIDLN